VKEKPKGGDISYAYRQFLMNATPRRAIPPPTGAEVGVAEAVVAEAAELSLCRPPGRR
jgi:hypothetical protein